MGKHNKYEMVCPETTREISVNPSRGANKITIMDF